MIKWEYKVIELFQGDWNMERCLNDLGKDGWELVCLFEKYQAIFKRSIPEQVDEEIDEIIQESLKRELFPDPRNKCRCGATEYGPNAGHQPGCPACNSDDYEEPGNDGG